MTGRSQRIAAESAWFKCAECGAKRRASPGEQSARARMKCTHCGSLCLDPIDLEIPVRRRKKKVMYRGDSCSNGSQERWSSD